VQTETPQRSTPKRPRQSLVRTIFSLFVLTGVLLYALDHLGSGSPCQRPITYTIGSLDHQFGLSKDDFLLAISDAQHLWENPVRKPLFRYAAADGRLKISLNYDARQQVTLTLQNLNRSAHADMASFDTLQEKFRGLHADYQRQTALLEPRVAAFEHRKASYDTEVSYWNTRGGAPGEVFERLEREKRALTTESGEINRLQTEINARVDDINAQALALNRMAASLNQKATEFHQIGSAHAGEFEEATFRSGPDGDRINVYQFDDRAKLVRVLAHELGHALGLEHLANPKAIMYRLNTGMNGELTTDDIAALQAHCKIT